MQSRLDTNLLQADLGITLCRGGHVGDRDNERAWKRWHTSRRSSCSGGDELSDGLRYGVGHGAGEGSAGKGSH